VEFIVPHASFCPSPTVQSRPSPSVIPTIPPCVIPTIPPCVIPTEVEGSPPPVYLAPQPILHLSSFPESTRHAGRQVFNGVAGSRLPAESRRARTNFVSFVTRGTHLKSSLSSGRNLPASSRNQSPEKDLSAVICEADQIFLKNSSYREKITVTVVDRTSENIQIRGGRPSPGGCCGKFRKSISAGTSP